MQVGSKCLEKVNDKCIKYEQLFKCPTSKRLKVTKIKGGKAPFCIGGDCVTPNYSPNTEMMEAISRLEILRKIQEDLRAKNIQIFDGKEPQKCSKYIVGFKDCCKKGKGWGVSLNLSDCNPKEILLSQNRSKNLCVYVGTYCAEKKAGQCIRKKSSFCCFGSRLARIIHEQGRPQLGISWGDAKHPQCRGFTADEISRIDFSKLDLSELYEELMSRYKDKDLSTYTSQRPNLRQNIDTQIKLIQKELSLPQDKKSVREM